MRLVDVQFCAHPSHLSLPDMIIDAVTTFKVPYSLAQADVDIVLPTKKVLDMEARLRQTIGDGQGEGGHNYEIKIWKDCRHGFNSRILQHLRESLCEWRLLTRLPTYYTQRKFMILSTHVLLSTRTSSSTHQLDDLYTVNLYRRHRI